jgi:hypothetical protein
MGAAPSSPSSNGSHLAGRSHLFAPESARKVSLGAEAEFQEVSRRLRTAIDRLPDRGTQILTLRYGVADGIAWRLDRIGDELGVTPERIRQLEKLALTRLRHPAFGLREADFLELGLRQIRWTPAVGEAGGWSVCEP